ncbi:hypothetical protein STEG23_006992 [Scotinomys teguina]
MEIPEECWPRPEVPLKDVTETMERHLSHIEQTVANSQNFSDRELLRFTSGGLALQGIYKTCHQKDLVARREELLKVPKEFFLLGSEQGKQMETKEFTSSTEQSLFTETVQKFGFRLTLSAKGGGWGFNLEGGMDKVKHSKSEDAHQSHSKHSYFCSSMFSYNPLASIHFSNDQLQLSTGALKELKIIEEQLEHTNGPDRFLLLRNRTENFFNGFGSHANQGPLHLGGIYCWKAISEGFESDQLDCVKQQTAEALDSYIRGSYSGFGIEVGGGMTTSGSHSVISYKNSTNQQLQIKVQLSVAQIGGPTEANGIVQWTTGLLTSNKTWSVVDREFQLMPIWDFILSSHRSDFKDPFLVANCLADNYSALTGVTAQIQAGEELRSAIKEAGNFLNDVKSWNVSDPEEQLKNLMGFMQALAHKTKDHDWENLEKNLGLLTDGNCGDTISSVHMDEVQSQLQSLCPEEKETHNQQDNENNQKEIIEKGPFLDLLQRLGLEHHYPKRMSRADFHLIYKTSVYCTQPRSEQELPFYFLQKLLMLDCGFRHLVFKKSENVETQYSACPSNQENDIIDPYEELFDDRHEDTTLETESQPDIHPMDIQMAIFHCADDLARQYILSKLSICQFALHLVVPNPNTSQMEFSLWSLRQIRRSWQEASESKQDKCYSHKKEQMCRVSTPVVSFIRVGNGFSASKSQIMNSLLSRHKHDVFFHRHCRGSSKHCLLMEGVVEICWFFPGGHGEDILNKCVAFINLHGDAKEHRQQLSFLQDVSSLMVILMSASDNNKENQNLVRHLWQSSKPLICLVDDKEKFPSNNTGRRVRIGIRNRNEAELTEEIMATIKHLLEISGTALSIEDCSQMAKKQRFLIDKDRKELKEAKEKAQTNMDLLEQYKLSKIKEDLLPLQGRLWHSWCKKDKELYHLQEKGA